MKVVLVNKYDWITDMTDKELEERYLKEVKSEHSSEAFIDALAEEATKRGLKLDWEK